MSEIGDLSNCSHGSLSMLSDKFLYPLKEKKNDSLSYILSLYQWVSNFNLTHMELFLKCNTDCASVGLEQTLRVFISKMFQGTTVLQAHGAHLWSSDYCILLSSADLPAYSPIFLLDFSLWFQILLSFFPIFFISPSAIDMYIDKIMSTWTLCVWYWMLFSSFPSHTLKLILSTQGYSDISILFI